MLAAYSAGEQVIGRQIIEAVADNLDMLPRKDSLHAADIAMHTPKGRVLRSETSDDLWKGQARTEAVKTRMFAEKPSNGNGSGHSDGESNAGPNAYSNRDSLVFEDTEDDVNLELGSLVG